MLILIIDVKCKDQHYLLRRHPQAADFGLHRDNNR